MGRYRLRLRELREAQGLTQQQPADAIGVSRETISRVESGKRPLSYVIERRIARHFNLTAAGREYLLGHPRGIPPMASLPRRTGPGA